MIQAPSCSLLLAVMGVSGCGKSTLGRSLASAMGAAFLDADDFHSAANVDKMRAGIALTDQDRNPWLVRLNSELKARRSALAPTVLACSALKQKHRAILSSEISQLRWVFLEGSFEQITARIKTRSASSNHYMPESLLQSQFAALERPVEALALSIELSTEIQTEQVIHWLAHCGRGSID
jgi:gluconokinase